MREIKFRAWDKLKKRMTDWEGILSAQNVGMIFEMKRVILQQFTGFQDKNGKEIFEGDIFKDGGIVFWNEKTLAFEFKYENDICFTLEDNFSDDSEIIGNIYENPELLKHDANCDKEVVE